MSENSKNNDQSTRKISLDEGRRLAIQLFDRQRPEPQKLTQKDRKKLNEIRSEVSELLKKVRSIK